VHVGGKARGDLPGYVLVGNGNEHPGCGFLDPAAATHKALTTDMNAGTSRAYNVLWSDTGASVWSGTAFVKSFGGTASEGQPLKFSAGFRTTGATTYPT
jgi:hypothetical protein